MVKLTLKMFEKAVVPQPYTENYKQLKKTETERNRYEHSNWLSNNK